MLTPVKGDISMRNAILALSFLAAAPIVAAQPAADDLSGGWRGGYLSTDQGDTNTFDMEITQTGNRITGTITEVNTIGNVEGALFLTSDLVGRVEGRTVTFTKTYDGSGGVSHSVQYRGTLDRNNRRIRGTYTVAGTVGGQFEMVR
jgi:hypothetical protein